MIEDIIMELEKIYDAIDKLKERVTDLEEDTEKKGNSNSDMVNSIIRRVDDIEEYLTVRSRGFFRRFIDK